MRFWPLYLVLGVGVGFVTILVLRNLRVALQYLLIVGRVALVLLLITIAGGLLGLWEHPRPILSTYYGLRSIWMPLQNTVSRWISSVLP